MTLPKLVFFSVAFALAMVAGYLFNLRYPEVALLVFTTTARTSEALLAVAVTAFTSPLVALTVGIGPSIKLPILIVILRILVWLRETQWYGGSIDRSRAHHGAIPDGNSATLHCHR